MGTKGYHAPNVMSVLAEQNSRKGDHDKAQTYIQRAMALATEVLDGVKVHKKYIGILAAKSQILLRRKKHAEALSAVDEMQTLVNEIYGQDNALMQAQLHLKRVLIYTEMKGEEYKAEDNLKLYAKVSEKIYTDLEGCKEDSCLNFTYQVELMTGYLKIMRPDKVTKIHKDLVKALEEKGQARSLAFLTVEFLSLQAEQDQSAVEGKIGQLLALAEELEQGKQVSIVSLYLRQYQISLVFQLQADFDQALKLTLELIKDSLDYFEGNDVAETLVDPYMIAASIYLQTNKIPEAAAYLKKAEAVVTSLSGEINEKSLEIFTLQIQINMMQ